METYQNLTDSCCFFVSGSSVQHSLRLFGLKISGVFYLGEFLFCYTIYLFHTWFNGLRACRIHVNYFSVLYFGHFPFFLLGLIWWEGKSGLLLVSDTSSGTILISLFLIWTVRLGLFASSLVAIAFTVCIYTSACPL
jgi:hypothetical protein